MKYCSRCGSMKPATEFSNSYTRASKLHTYCKECVKRDYNQTRIRYGTTPEELFKEQKGMCTFCWEPLPVITGSKAGYVVIDHDTKCCSSISKRTCGKCIRGLIHHKCNIALGYYERFGPNVFEEYIHNYSTRGIR